MTARNILRKLPWKIALPAIMIVITMLLLHLDQIWLRKTRGIDDMPVTSAWGLICLLSWPALFLTFWLRYLPSEILGFDLYDWGRFAAALLFWACMGSLLDRRLAGVVGPIVRSKPMRISFYALGFLLSLYALGFGGIEVVGLSITWFPHIGEIVRSKWVYLLGRELNTLAAAIWGLVGVFYFGKKLLRSGLKSPTSSPTITDGEPRL